MEHTIRSGWLVASLDQTLRDRLLIALFLLAAALFLFVDGRTVPIILWDESRNAVNALEMRARGLSVITTYEFQPDHWNTKPPLLIWAMTGSMALFGPSEWSLRLPSALAALGTLLCLILFVRKTTGSLGTGLLAATFLLLSPGFFGEHGARTGDYDVLLLFFVTAALQLLFLAIHKSKPDARLLVAAGGLVALAGLTKTIAAFIPFTGVLAYILASRRWPRLLTQWRAIALATAVALAPLLTFYVARSLLDPGFLSAILYNDLGGRFMEPVTGAPSGSTYYVAELLRGWFFAGPLLLAILLAFPQVRGSARLLLLWSLFVAGGTLLIYSVASTRLIHYALPVFPWLAIAVAISLRTLARRYLRTPWQQGSRLVPIVSTLFIAMLTVQLTARAAWWRTEGFPHRQVPPQAAYGDLFEALSANGLTTVTVVDKGFSGGDRPNYLPLMRVYELIWRERGFRVDRRIAMPVRVDKVLASCEPASRDFWSHPRLLKVLQCGVIMPER